MLARCEDANFNDSLLFFESRALASGLFLYPAGITRTIVFIRLVSVLTSIYCTLLHAPFRCTPIN